MHYCGSLTTQAHGCIAQGERLLAAPEAQAIERISPERAAELKRQIRAIIQEQEAVAAQVRQGMKQKETMKEEAGLVDASQRG